MLNHIHDFSLLSICSGSGRLLLTMTGLPFQRPVLFPIDLRYGWDMNYKPHQQWILHLDSIFKPKVISIEPRCKHWSRSGNTRDPELTVQLRQAEQPMLRFFLFLLSQAEKDQRDGLAENPQGSDIWRHSPLQALDSISRFQEHSRDTDQCPFSPVPDGERHKKRTKLKATFPLNHCIKSCRCKYPHIVLQGYDPDKHQQRTAAAALFPLKLCQGICADIDTHLRNKVHKLQRRHRQHTTQPSTQPTVPPPATPIFAIEQDDDIPDPNASSSTTLPQETLEQQLRKIDTRSLKLYDSTGITDNLDRQLLLASLQDILDDSHKLFRQGNFNVIHLSNTHQVNLASMKFLLELLKLIIKPILITSHSYINGPSQSNDLYKSQQLPTQSLAQLTIYVSTDATFHVQLRKDYQLTDNWTLPDDMIFVLLIYGNLTTIGERLGQLRRLTTKTSNFRPPIEPPPGLERPLPDEDETIRINGRNLKAFRPNVDLRKLPLQLINANLEERKRLLTGLHERFWHAPPQDMLRLLQAALLPKDIVLQGIEIARSCKHCNRFSRHLPKAKVKSFLASTFNEIVQCDLFFIGDEVFILLIDECLRWKTGNKIDNKLSETMTKAILYLWIRMFGPMAHLLSDQEGGLASTTATTFFEKFGITRLFVGQGATGTKGLVERHIGLVKHSMLCLRQAAHAEGLQINSSDICMEACMAQNLLLEYNGGTPQAALIGSYQRPFHSLDSDSIQATTGALETRPDYIESSLRLRLLAKQAIAQSIIQDRLARAA